LALFDAAGRAIVQTNDGRIDLHLNLEPGQGQRFWFRVTGLGGAGSYRLTSTFEASGAALSTLRGLGGQLLGGDFNNDGIADILAHGQEGAAQPLARLLLGLGDGTFREAGAAFEVGHNLAAGDFDGDGRLDLLYTRMQPWGSVLCVQLGRGDGTFAAALETPQVSMGFASAAATGDFNRDGWLDVVCDQAIYLGRGDGTFAAAQTLGTSPVFAMLAADFNGDGWLDLVQALQGGGLAVLLGRGDGSFEAPLLSATGLPFGATGLQAGDVNRDGWLDLLAGQTNTGDFPVFLGRGNGTFADPVRLAGGGVLGYFDRDAQLDLLGPDTLQVGRGDGSFRAVGPFSAPTGGDALAGDWNRDGILDLAVGMAGAINVTTGQISPSSLNVLLGAADGSWTTTSDAARLPVPASSVVAADVDRDGFLDLLYASGDYNPFSPSRAPATLHTQRGGGDGSFSPLAALPIAGYPQALIPHDFNGDGRLDVAALNVTYLGDTSDLSVYLGVGDGSFAEVQRVSLGSRFRATDIAAGDFNGDGRLDLVVAVTEFPSPDNFFAPIRTTVRLLLGNADGTFHEALSWQPALDFPVFTASEVFAGDVNGDRRLDVVVVGWSQVAVFLGNGDGTFQEQRDTPRDQGAPVALTGDFNGDGRLDLLGRGVGNRWNIQTGNADGTFQTAFWISPELDSDRLFTPTDGQAAVGDFNRDGHLDLAGVRDADGRLFLLLGQGDGTFELQTMPDAGGYVRQLLVVDANRDGRADLTCLLQDGRVLTLLGNGDGQFVSAEEIPQHAAAPGLADFNGDGAVDVVTLTERGELLYRQARPREPGAFEPARLVNAGQPVRAFAIVQGSTGPLLAAIRTDGAGVVLYRRTASGGFSVAQELPVGDFPTLIVAGNYSGTPNGRADDFAVYNALSGTVSLFIVGAGGRYGAAQTFAVGAGMTALTIAPGTHGRDELILADRSGAQVLVLANDGQGNLGEPQRWRAGDGLYTWQASRADVQSRLATSLLAVGQFTADGVSDLVAVSTGQLGLLAGGANGGWHDPRLTALTFGASALAIGRFDGDAYADVALLDAENGTIRVFLGDGRGGFVERVQAAPLLAGNATTGLTARDLDGDGRLDLLVGNTYGDLLVLPGNGDGTFRPYQRATGTVALAVADLDGDGRDDFVLGNAALDRVSIQFGGQAPGVLQGRAEGILAPTAVKLADLNGDGIADLAVANSGGNNVLIYLGLGGGAFAAPRSYFAGTTPVALYVATLDNGDALPDLVVVNQGSNDISVLFGQGTGADWTLTYGPRLRSGGVGPNSAVIRDVTGDGVQDIVATNGASNIVAVLTGSGQGFFNDISPLLLNTGAGPVQVLVGNFDGRGGLDLISVNRQAGNLTFFAGFGPGRTIGTGGQAAVAVSADFNGDGLTDLLVANQGGTLAFLLGGLGGPGIAELLSAAPLDHPSALVLAGADGKTINIYATNEGDDRVFRFTLEPDLQPVQGDLTPLQGAQAASVASLIVGQHPLDEYRLPEQATGPAAGFEGLVAGLPSSLPGTTAPTEGTTGSESFDLAPGDSTLPMLQRWLDATLGQPTWLEFEDAVFEALQVAWDAVRGQAREQWDRLAPPWRDLIESLWQAVSGARANRSPANGSAGLEESGCGFPQAPFNEWELFEQSSADVSVNDLASDDLLPPCEEVTTMAQAVDRLRRHASGESNSDCLLYVCFTAVICEHVSPPAERRHGRRKSPAPNESSAA
ncbi:MAG: VCBS repeat-containing protein, partial [Planctomycetia bacterium]|nr:VCBS repeat-containing protein [Planctomycetia bacterium]